MKDKPNILMLFYDHQAFYGHGEMVGGPKILRPNFEKLASQGIKFTRAYTCCPLCGPARRSILTGLFPHNHGEIKNDANAKYKHEIYLNKLAKIGYKNYYYGKWHAGRGSALDFNCEGFSHYGYGNPYNKPEYKEYLKKNNLPFLQARITHSFLDPEGSYTKTQKNQIGQLHLPNFRNCTEFVAGIMTTPKETHESFFLASLAKEKLKEISENNKLQPFHMRVDFWGPHHAYFATQEFLDLYDPKKIPELPSFNEDLKNKPAIYKKDIGYGISKNKELILPNPKPWEEWQEILALNYAQQTLMDEAAGTILQALEDFGLYENTIVVWTTDHGDAVACHGGHFDKDAYMPEEMVRIPMAIRYPGVIEPEQVSEKLVSNLDLSPTFLDAAGSSFNEQVDGESLLPICLDKDANWRDDLMCETHGHYTTHLGRLIVTQRYKYIYNEEDMDELYDLEKDPFELNNLISNESYSDVLNDMKQRLKTWRQKTSDNVTKSMIKGRRLVFPKK